MQQILKATTLTQEDLEKINHYSRRPLSPEEVYTFSVVLCDNEIDRDGEAFSDEALARLAELFVGKTGIFDHDPSGKNQTARIFAATAEPAGELTRSGLPRRVLKAQAYMVRSERCRDTILEIDAGILKEVSVGCRVAHKRCSICGAEYDGCCGHLPGEEYDGKLCYIQLEQPLDAYEWSFVAIPAQPGAGVTKGYTVGSAGDDTNKAAALARRHTQKLRGELVRLAYLDGFMQDDPAFASAVCKMNCAELEAFAGAFRRRLSPAPPQVQLAPPNSEQKGNGAFAV